jgi:hypothetical protein
MKVASMFLKTMSRRLTATEVVLHLVLNPNWQLEMTFDASLIDFRENC